MKNKQKEFYDELINLIDKYVEEDGFIEKGKYFFVMNPSMFSHTVWDFQFSLLTNGVNVQLSIPNDKMIELNNKLSK